jgi:hypothetical protein
MCSRNQQGALLCGYRRVFSCRPLLNETSSMGQIINMVGLLRASYDRARNAFLGSTQIKCGLKYHVRTTNYSQTPPYSKSTILDVKSHLSIHKRFCRAYDQPCQLCLPVNMRASSEAASDTSTADANASSMPSRSTSPLEASSAYTSSPSTSRKRGTEDTPAGLEKKKRNRRTEQNRASQQAFRQRGKE